VPVSVFIPKSTPPVVGDLLREQGAEVIVHGDYFGMANERAIEEGKKPGQSYIHPYLHPETWHVFLVTSIRNLSYLSLKQSKTLIYIKILFRLFHFLTNLKI